MKTTNRRFWISQKGGLHEERLSFSESIDLIDFGDTESYYGVLPEHMSK